MTVHRWNVWVWAAVATLLLLPLVAMQFTAEMRWTGADFVFAALLLGGAAGLYELLSAGGVGRAYRAGAAVAVLIGLSLAWVDAAVGIVGDGSGPTSLSFAGVIAVAVGGALVAKGRARGMARAMAAAALAQLAVAAIALSLRWGSDGSIWPRDVIGATVVFAGMWLVAAGLFGRSAREIRDS